MLKSPLSQVSKQEDVVAWPALSHVQTKPWGSACCCHRMRLPGPRRKPETDQCKVSYGNHYVCLLQVAQNWLGLRGDTFRRRLLRIAFAAVCKWLHGRRTQPSKLARKPAKEKTSCILRSRIPPKKPKRSKPRPRNLSLPSKIPKKTKKTKDRREMAATSGICRGTGGICLRFLFF